MAAFTLAALAGCGGSGGGGSSPSAGPAVQFREFAVPVGSNTPSDPHPGSWPDDLVFDPDGTIWFAEHHADQIGLLTPSGSGFAYQGFPVPTPNSEMDSIAVDTAHHRVWVSENTSNKLALLDANTPTPQVTEYSVTTSTETNPVPGDLALDAAGNVWFTAPYDSDTGVGMVNALGELDATTHQVHYFPTPTATGGMDGLAFDKTGALWFIEIGASRLGRYAGGVFTEYAPPRPNTGLTNLAVDGVGRVWVTEQAANAVAVFDPAAPSGQAWREIPVPTPGSGPVAIAVDPSGNVWFGELAAGKIGLIRAGSATAVDFPIPTPNSAPEDIQAAPDGRVFFTERYGNKIGQVILSH